MREVESLPTYGIHYYDVKDRNDLPWYIGLSNRGISQYDYLDKRKPRRVFLWRQLENIYFRERKFSIEVLDPKRVCVSRRSLGSASASVTVHVWFAESQAQCKAIWSMAIAQHQFYLDTKALRSEEQSAVCDMPELAVDLSRSCLSLSTHSSSSNLSRSGSHSSLQQHSQAESGSSESLEAARLEMLEALRLRRSGLQEKLSAKTEELRLLCLREGELTGELPPEYPLVPGQPPPSVRKRVGTSFALDESIIDKIINKQEETVSALELECEIMAKITSAALRLANESTARKGVRRQRKLSYQQSAHRLRELEQKLKQARSKAVVTASTLPKQKKKPRPLSDCEGIEDSGITGSLSSSAGSGRESPRDLTGFQSTLPSPSLNNTLTLHDANGSRLRDRNSTFTSHDTSDSSRQSDRNSTITPRDTSDGSRQNGRNNHHDNTDSGRQRDRSPHRTRGSAPASPYRSAASTCSSNSGGGGDAGGGGGGGSLGDGSGSVHNSTMTSSSSSRPTSPSCPSSGYIPNSVYACSQYRSQRFPTLPTRSRSTASPASFRDTFSRSWNDNGQISSSSVASIVSCLTYITTTTIVTSERRDTTGDTNNDQLQHDDNTGLDLLESAHSHQQEFTEGLARPSLYDSRCSVVGGNASLQDLSDTLTVALLDKNHESRPPNMRQSRSVPRELDPSRLSYEAHLTRDPLNLCVDTAILEGEKLSFPGGLYNISSRQRETLSTQSMNNLDSTGSSSCSSPSKPSYCDSASIDRTHTQHSSSPNAQHSPSFHHPHHHNHLPHLHSNRRHRMQMPDRPLSSDRRRGNSASRAEVFRTTPDTPDHAAACQLLDGALFNYHPHYQSGTPRVPEHFDPHQLVQQGPNVNFHYNHQARRHTSGSKLRHSNSSAMHNTSGSSLSSSQPHNTTSSSISSSTSGNHCTPPNRQSLYSPYVGGNPHNGYSMGPVQHHTPQNNGMYFQDHHGAYYSPSSHGIHNDHRQTNAGYVREMQRRTSQEPSYYNPHQTINSSYPTPPPHQSYSTSQTQREVLAKVSPENVSSPSRSRHGQSKELTASDSGCGADSSCDTRQSNADVSDGHPNATHPAPVSQNYSNSSFPHSDEHSYQSCSKSDDLNPEPIHTLVRTSSGRSYMETTFLGDCSSASSTTSNQENIPPVKRVVPSEQLLPLKPTGVHLRASASVTPADLAPPRLLPAADLIPLRATKSSSELPPLKATNPRGEYHGSNSNAEPLMSLAEAANLKKDREREWYETSLDSPGSGRKPQKCAAAEIVISKFPGIASASATAVSSNNDVSSSALSPELPSNSPNERDQSVIISTGSYQPSREVSKPFEMADFYKYSTKYRKQMHGSGMNSSNSSFSNGSDSNHMSPVLPPRAQVVVSSSKAAPPSPNVIAKQSTPAAQQKGIYQSLAPYTCQGVGSHPSPGAPNTPSWEGTPLHQAVPATVTNKRSATLV
ncbi:dentin sialophosphoprotein isoform X1 [Hyalella azteca]|uniref:Dentin sialophosphoprotein isoform X1 n=1 Tax=Hyalella azteca TaxID=294128 RepID=A0A979FP54_HYAAZ|nr:dentin sialophosphoprotein isoform X1 [Hyalella azteca]